MSSPNQDHLDRIRLQEQTMRRQINEEAELARRSIEISIQRCELELGITDPSIASAIAREVLEAEEAERQQMASVRLLWRERRRLTGTGGQPIPDQPVDAARRIEDKGRELSSARITLHQGRQERRHKLRRFINQRRIEFRRVDGRHRVDTLEADFARERAANPHFNGIGHLVPWGESFIRVGEADDYLTIHNPAYPRGPIARDLASNFRNIKAKGINIAIRALKHAHGQAYAGMMGDRNELSCSRLEPGLFRPDPTLKRQPVTARIIALASDAGHGRGYALAVQGHGDDGPFHGIASYNHISDVSPNDFFGADNLGDKPCRMVDFNFQLISGRLSLRNEVEVGTLLIEIARFSFGARLFRSECSPLNTRYINIMKALGLDSFQAIEPASYNSSLAASTWKFDLCTWKSMEEQLRFQGLWFVSKDTMQEDPDAANQMHDDPDEPLPDLANVYVEPTIFEDPAAFEPMEEPTQSAFQPPAGSIQWPQDSESMEWSSGSYLTGTTPTNDSGTSSGLGHSDSAHSRSTPSTFHDNSHTGSSSGSSGPRPHEAGGPFKVGDGQTSSSTQKEKKLVWQGAAAMKALRDEEAARAMPPPELPKRLTLQLQHSSAKSSAAADYALAASGSMEIDSQAAIPYDPKDKRPASSFWIDQPGLGQPGPSTEAARPIQVPYDYEEEQSVSDFWPTSDPWPDSDPWPTSEPWTESAHIDAEEPSHALVPYDRKGKGRASEPWPNPTDPGMEEVSQAVVPYDRKGKGRASEPWPNPTDLGMEETSQQVVVPYDRKGKRPASLSWDTQPKRPSPLQQNLASKRTVAANARLPSASVGHHIPPQSLNVAPDAASPQTARSDCSDVNRRRSSPHHALNQSTNTGSAHLSTSPSHSQPTLYGPQSPVTWQENQSSSRDGDSAAPPPSLPHSLSLSYTVEAGTPKTSPSWAPSADQRRLSGASTGPAIHNLLSSPLAEVAQPNTVPNASGFYNDWYEDGTRSQTETLSVASEVFAAVSHPSVSETTPSQAWSSRVHREVPPPQAVAMYSPTRGEHVSGTTTNMTQFANPLEPQQPIRSVQTSSPVIGFEHPQQYQVAHARQTGTYAQPGGVSQYTVRQQVPEHYNLALYNYVEFVEEKLSEQVRCSESPAAMPADTEKSSSKGLQRHQPRQPGTQGAPVDRQAGRRNTAARGPARGVSKPQQKGSNGARQSTLGSYQANGPKNATNTKKAPKSQQNTTRVESYYLGQPGPSSPPRPQPSQDKGQGRKRSPAPEPTSISRATTARRTTSLDTLLSNIALTPESYATSMSDRASRPSASSSIYPRGDGQTSPLRGAHESNSTREMTTQQAASQQAVLPQVGPPQVNPQQLAPQSTALSQTTCRQEKQMQDKAKQRPWQL